MILMTYSSFSAASSALNDGANFAVVQRWESDNELDLGLAFEKFLKANGMILSCEREYVPAGLEAAALMATYKLSKEKGILPCLLKATVEYLLDLLTNISRGFDFDVKDIAIYPSFVRPEELPFVSEFRFHTDGGNYFLLHTLAGEAGTEVASLDSELYEEILSLDTEWRRLVKLDREGQRAEALVIKETIHKMVPQDSVTKVAPRETLILRGTESSVNGKACPTIHQAPSVPPRLLLTIFNLTPRN